MTFTSGVWCPFSTELLHAFRLRNECWDLQTWKIVICLSWYPSWCFVTQYILFCSFCFYIVFFLSCFHLCEKKSSRFVSGQCSVEPWSCHELAFAPPPHPFLFSMISHVVIFRDFWTKKFLNICFSVTEFGIEKSKQKLPSSIF